MTEGLDGLGDLDTSESPDKWTTKELEELVTECFNQQTLADNSQTVSDNHREKQRELERKIQSYLEYYGKDKHVSSVGTIEVRTRHSFKTPKTDEDKERFFTWLREKGIFHRYVGVNSQALNGLLKQELETANESGQELRVPGIEAATEFKTIHLRRSK